MPLNNSTRNEGLNADMVDGLHASDFVYSLDTSGDYVRWQKYNGNWNNLTVPYATSANYLRSPYSYPNNTITDSTTSGDLKRNGEGGCALVAFHYTDWGWSDTLYFTGYGQWGGTEIATKYNATENVRLKIRKFSQSRMDWGDWTEILTDGNYTNYVNNYYWANIKVSTTANYLTTPYTCYVLFRNTDNNGAAGYVGRGGNTNAIQLTAYSGNILQLGSNGNDGTITIATNGKVGIGTASPSQKLHVNGEIQYNTSLFAANGKEIFCTGDYLAINSDLHTRTATFNLQDVYMGYSSGKVGIGTTEPSYKLHVNGTGAFNNIQILTEGPTFFAKNTFSFINTNLNDISFGNGYAQNSKNAYYDGYNLYLRYGSIPSIGIILNNLGNVGINTTSPLSKLEVAGNITLPNTGEIYFRYDNSTNSIYTKIGKGSVRGNVYTDYTLGDIEYLGGGWTSSTDILAHLFRTGNTDAALAIRNNGNIGIGTTSPDKPLTVIGTIKTYWSSNNSYYCEMLIDSTTWMNFVTNCDNFYFNKTVSTNGNIYPYANNSYSLGTSSNKWSSVYAYGFYKNGSDNTYVLQGGGGHKLESSLNVNSAKYIASDYYYDLETPTGTSHSIDDTRTASQLKIGTHSVLFPTFHKSGGMWWDEIFFSGYDIYGATQFATQYNASKDVRVKIRKYNQTLAGWGEWTEFITSGNIASQSVSHADTAGGLSTTYYWANVAISTSVNRLTIPSIRYVLFRDSTDTVNSGYIGRGGDNSWLQFSGYENVAVGIGANNSDTDIYIKTNHNVGIGTSNPQYKLHVNGSFYSSGSISSKDFFSGIDGAGLYFEGNSTNGLRIQYPRTIDSNTGARSNYDGLLLQAGTLKFNGNTVWHAANDGSGSGLDADLLDGHDSSYFSISTHTHTYIVNAYDYPNNTIDDSVTSASLNKGSTAGSLCIGFHWTGWPSGNDYSDTLYWTGYGQWGGTELATHYNMSKDVEVKIRKFTQSGSKWGDWTYFITSGNIGSQSVSYANNAGYADTAGSASSLSSTYYWGNIAISKTQNYLTTPYTCYVLFRNTTNDNAAGYVGRGSSSSNEIQLCGYSGNAINIGANNGSGHIYINTSGNVGIGRTSISYKLHVNGLIGISSEGCDAYIGAANSSWFHVETNGRQIYISSEAAINGLFRPYSNNTKTLGTSSYYWNTLYCNYINGSNTFIHSGNIGSQSVNYATYAGSASSASSASSATVATYLSSPYYYSGNTISDSTTSDSLAKGGNPGTVLVAFHNTGWGWSDTLYWSGYDKWGGTELATEYNARNNVRLKIRKYNQSVGGWGDWTTIITSGNIGDYTSSVSVTNSAPALGKTAATIATIGGTAITASVGDSDKVDGLHFWTGSSLPSSPSSDTIYIIV